MSNLTVEIEKHINKLVNPLKVDEELTASLKLKLTKKEFKLLNDWANNEPIQNSKTKLNLDDEKYGELSSKLIKKLNQEKTKQAICI